MDTFKGFPPGKVRLTSIPASFFSDLLPLIDDLAELKVTLFCFWALEQKGQPFNYLRRRDFVGNDSLMRGLGAAAPLESDAILDAALARSLTRGVLLGAQVALDSGTETLYFVNTARGRAAVEQINAGRWRPGDADNPIEILPERPNIYQLYEANIGLLTPRIADHLKDAEHDFPLFWIEEAIDLAVVSNKRSWRYISAILKRWEREGRSRETFESDPQRDGRSYIQRKYADVTEP